MSRLALAVAVSLGTGVASAENAPTVPAGNRTSIALIDMARVFKNYEVFEERTDDLKADVGRTTNQLKTMAALGVDLKKGLDAAKTPEERARFERDLLKLKSEMENLKTLTQSDLARREARIYSEVYVEIRAAVTEYAREQGYTIVLRFAPEELNDTDEPKVTLSKLNRLVVFAEEHHDITDAIIERLNEADTADDETSP